MCIIVAKKKEVELPSMETLETCFKHNSDGAGLMYVDDGQVIIDKGFMTFEIFKSHFEKLCKKYNNFKNKALVVHFRIGTSGTNTKENTHPYCISDDYRDLHKTKVRTPLGMAHNGIINQYTPIENVHNTNDTQEFIMKYLTPLYKNYRTFYTNEYIMDGLSDITNSKLVFLNGNEDLYFVGDFIEDNGVMYSNSTYKPYTYKYGTYWDKYNPRTYDTELGYYIKNKGYTYLTNKGEVSDDFDETHLDKLEPNWTIANDYGYEKVGDRDLYIDFWNFDLYERKENNTYFKIGENTFVYDEDMNDLY